MTNYNFIRLTFDGVTTSDLNLYVVSNSGRYATPLTSKFENRTTSIPGRPGLVYWGVDLGAREFNLELATDGMTEAQLNRFKQYFAPGRVGELSFEETPYIYHDAFIISPPVFSFLPFRQDASGVNHVYKGEISLQLSSLKPYGISRLTIRKDGDDLIYENSGIPLITQFPIADNVIYYLARNERIRNRSVYLNKANNVSGITIYHAGSAPTPVNFRFEKTYTLSGSGSTIRRTNWSDIQIGESVLSKPRFLIDIEYALDLVLANFEDWDNQKTNVLNMLREELDGPARDSIVYLVRATGAGLTHTTVEALQAKLLEIFFTGVVYRFSINTINNQCKLDILGAKQVSTSLQETPMDYTEDNSGSFNGRYVYFKPSGLLPVAGSEIIVFNQPLNEVEVFFYNTYV